MPVKELAVCYCSSDLEIGKEFLIYLGNRRLRTERTVGSNR